MADVCIIYSRHDADHLPPALEKLLSPRFSVWWDKKINHGDYRKEILNQLRTAGCILPIWSPKAADSIVIEEAEHAKDYGVPLLPIKTHSGRAPLGFDRDEMTIAAGWNGELDNSQVTEHLAKIDRTLARRRGPKSRPASFLPGLGLDLPAYFFSLSSYETKISPEPAIRALSAVGVKSVLVSAQDTSNKPPRHSFIAALRRLRRADGFVLLDSGNYEEGRRSTFPRRTETTRADMTPRWTLTDYHAALTATPHDMAFCFDKTTPPANDLHRIVGAAVNAVERDQKHSAQPVLPIVHLPRDRNGNILTQHAAQAVHRVATSLEPPLIGIPERELGDGIIARTTTMRRIRQALDSLCYYQSIHVLGTGDPISIALLSAAGADSFDGLEWCRFALDADNARLYPLHDYDLFQWQDKLSRFGSDTDDEDGHVPLTWLGNVAVHNIEFYLDWMARFRKALPDEKRLVQFLTRLLPGDTMDMARTALWEDE